MKSDKYYIFCIITTNYQKSLQQCIQIIIIMEENVIVIRDPKTFSFDFNENLKHEFEFIIKSNESLGGNKIKNKIE